MPSTGGGIICLILGGYSLGSWWLEMFSDCKYAQFCRRSAEATRSNLGRNTTALVKPALGVVFLIGGIMNFLQSADQPLLRAAGLVLSLPCVLLLVVALVGIIPFGLPDRMYPEFQLEKRRRLAAESAENTELTGSAPASASGGEQQRTPSDSTTTFAIPKTFPRSRATKANRTSAERTAMNESVHVILPRDWSVIDPSALPPGFIDPAGPSVRYLAAATPSTPGPDYAPNLIVVAEPLGSGEDAAEALSDSVRVMADAVPGMRVIEDVATGGRHHGERLRCGFYILDDEALTVVQVAWLDAVAGRVGLWTATFTCRTRDFGARVGEFNVIADSLEVTA